jgi:hypothetical protein
MFKMAKISDKELKRNFLIAVKECEASGCMPRRFRIQSNRAMPGNATNRHWKTEIHGDMKE